MTTYPATVGCMRPLEWLFILTLCSSIAITVLLLLTWTNHNHNYSAIEPPPPPSRADKWVILFDPLHSGFVSRGGLGQWYHLTERVMTMHTSSDLAAIRKRILETVLETHSSSHNRTLFLVFREKRQVLHGLNSFSRLMLSTLFTYEGSLLFSTIAFAYTQPPPRLSWIDSDLSMATLVRYAVVVFATSMHTQTSIDLFHTSIDLTAELLLLADTPSHQVLQVAMPIEDLSPAYAWFNCSLLVYLQWRESVAQLCADPTLVPLQTTKLQVNISASADNIAPSDEKIPLNLLPGMYSFEHKLYNTIWQGKPEPGFMARARIELDTQTRMMLIYQRNKGRVIDNIDHVQSRLSSELGALNWTTHRMVHSNARPICVLLRQVASSKVLFTSHGFQSTLLLFQPLHSVLVETHPKYVFAPEFYGYIQAGFRSNFNLARSYLTEESNELHSSMLSTVITAAVMPVFDDRSNVYVQGCASVQCKRVARMQSVIVSDELLTRTVLYLKEHFK